MSGPGKKEHLELNDEAIELRVDDDESDTSFVAPDDVRVPLNESTGGFAESETSVLDDDTAESDGAGMAQANNLIGTIVGGHFLIRSFIGSGGMSEVYEATNMLLNKPVAIKFIRSGANNHKLLMRFQQEARASSQLNHPAIACTREFGLDQDGRPYLVMDLVAGTPLSERLSKDGPLEPDVAVKITRQLCEALEHAHSRNVVHRDIKPSNIILTVDADGSERAVLIDFGIAKLLQAENEGIDLTQTGEVFGSPGYMSPEQCRGGKLDARSDIYSLGCVLYQMIEGRLPFSGSTPLETILKHANEMPDAPVRLSRELEQICFKCLEKPATQRYQSGAALNHDLSALSKGTFQFTGGAFGLLVRRIFASFIDFSIFAIPLLIATVLSPNSFGNLFGACAMEQVMPFSGVLFSPEYRICAIAMFFVFLFYHALMESSLRQATLGKLCCGLRVFDRDGRRLTFLRAALRHVTKQIILFSILMVPLILIASGKAGFSLSILDTSLALAVGWLIITAIGFVLRKRGQFLHDVPFGSCVKRTQESASGVSRSR